jgi:hypothetical protein
MAALIVAVRRHFRRERKEIRRRLDCPQPAREHCRMGKVDRAAIGAALKRLEEGTWSLADKAIQLANANASKGGMVGSGSHHSMIVSGASEGYRAGLSEMVDVVRNYAGAAAPKHAGLLAASADRVKERLAKAHGSRLNALGSKFSKVKEQHAILIGDFTKTLDDARDAAISDLKHTLQDPQDALSWWHRHVREIQLGLVNAIIAAIVSAVVAWIVATLTAPAVP